MHMYPREERQDFGAKLPRHLLGLDGNLLYQLAGGGQHHSNGALSLATQWREGTARGLYASGAIMARGRLCEWQYRLELGLIHDVDDHRPDVGRGLAAPGLGNANDIPATERCRNGLRGAPSIWERVAWLAWLAWLAVSSIPVLALLSAR